MATKTRVRRRGKSKKNRSNGGDDFFKTGMDTDDLRAELKKSGGGGDPELLILRDGDQAEISIVTSPREWGTYRQHYLGQEAGYRLCSGEGCIYCDDGLGASQRTMMGVYVHSLYQAERGDYKARKTRNMGYKFLPLNKETTEGLLRRAARRGNTLSDRRYVIERHGGGTDTKYDIDRTEEKTKRKIVSGWTLSVPKKLRRMKREEDESINVGGKKSRDDDYDYEGSSRRKKKSRRRSRR